MVAGRILSFQTIYSANTRLYNWRYHPGGTSKRRSESSDRLQSLIFVHRHVSSQLIDGLK
jgi:hypothetical protein